LIKYLRENEQTLLGVGDASVKADQSSHAWIVSTGEPQHLGDPYMSITGAGPVDGHLIIISRGAAKPNCDGFHYQHPSDSQ
jgi:hypothetical protein